MLRPGGQRPRPRMGTRDPRSPRSSDLPVRKTVVHEHPIAIVGHLRARPDAEILRPPLE